MMLFRDALGFEEKTAAPLQLDTLLPFQFYSTFRRKTFLEPEKLLMLAVLEDAFVCLQKFSSSSSGKGKRLFEQTREWFLDDDGNWTFSFVNICETFGLNPRYLRRGLARFLEGKGHPAGAGKRRTPRSSKRSRKKSARKAA